MFDRYDPRSDDRDRGGSCDRSLGSRGATSDRERHEERDPRDVFTKDLDLPRSRERYDNQKLENLQAAAARLERGETFTPPPVATVEAKPRTSDRKRRERRAPSNRQDFVKSWGAQHSETDADREPETSTNSHADQDLADWLGGRDSNPDNVVESQALRAFSEAKKKSSMIARRCGIDSAALIETRRWEPLSSPFVYQEFRARSLLMTHRSWPRAAVDAGGGWPGATCRNPSASPTRSVRSSST